MGAVTAARLREVPRTRGDDNHSPVSAGQDDPLEICHRGGQCDLMDDDYLADHVEITILQLAYSRDLSVRIGTAKTHIIKTVDHNRCISWKAGAVVVHLREDAGDRVGGEDPPAGGEDPPAGGDGLRDDAECGGGVGELGQSETQQMMSKQFYFYIF